MENVSERPDTFFRLSPASRKARCFSVERGEVLKRTDVTFHQPWIRARLALLEKSNFPVNDLGTVVDDIRYGTGSPPPYLNKSDNTVPFVRATDIKDGEINVATLLHVSARQPEHMNKCRLRGGELIIVRSGVNTGDCAVVPESLANSFAAYDLILTIRSASSAKFVATFLDTEIGRLQLNLVKGRAAQPHVNAEEIATLQIPLPSIVKQSKLNTAMDEARADRKAKLAKADELLAGLDDFVLEILGLKSNTSQKAVFAVRATDVLSSRFDADFHSLQFRTIRNRIEKGRYPARSLTELCEYLVTGFAAGRKNQAFEYESGVPHLRPLNLDIFGQLSLEGTKLVPKEGVTEGNWCVRGEVLFNNTNSTEMVGKSAVFDLEQSCACSNHVTRLKPGDGVAPEYLAAVLNALRRIGYLSLLSTNFNNQAGINTETLKQLRLPKPSPKEQEPIVAEVRRRRDEARRLHTEAEAAWQAAKRWFEEQLLGSTTP